MQDPMVVDGYQLGGLSDATSTLKEDIEADDLIETCVVALNGLNVSFDANSTSRLAVTAINQFLFFTNQVPFIVARLEKEAPPNEKIQRKRADFFATHSKLVNDLGTITHLAYQIPSTRYLQGDSSPLPRARIVVALGNPTLPGCKFVMLFECDIPSSTVSISPVSFSRSCSALAVEPGDDHHSRPVSPSSSDIVFPHLEEGLPYAKKFPPCASSRSPVKSFAIFDDHTAATNSSVQTGLSVSSTYNHSTITQGISPEDATPTPPSRLNTCTIPPRTSFIPFNDSTPDETSLRPVTKSNLSSSTKKGLVEKFPPNGNPNTYGIPYGTHHTAPAFDESVRAMKDLEKDIIVSMSNLDLFMEDRGLSRIHVYARLYLPEDHSEVEGWHPRPQVAKLLNSLFDYPHIVEAPMKKKIERMKGRVCKIQVHGFIDNGRVGNEDAPKRNEIGNPGQPENGYEGIWLEWDGILNGVE